MSGCGVGTAGVQLSWGVGPPHLLSAQPAVVGRGGGLLVERSVGGHSVLESWSEDGQPLLLERRPAVALTWLWARSWGQSQGSGAGRSALALEPAPWKRPWGPR